MSVTATGSRARLDIGQTLQEVLNVCIRNFGPFTLLSVLLIGVPTALIDVGRLMAASNGGYAFLTILGAVASLVTRPILYGALVYATMRDLDGEPAPLGECLAAGRRRWGAVLGLMLLSGLGIVVGFILLIVPGVILALRWAVAGPMVVLSGRGVSDAMDRSANLTLGRRWGMLLVYLIVYVLFFVFAVLLSLLEDGLSGVASKVLVTGLIDPISNVYLEIILAVIATVLYRRLRGDAEGPATAALAEVFA